MDHLIKTKSENTIKWFLRFVWSSAVCLPEWRVTGGWRGRNTLFDSHWNGWDNNQCFPLPWALLPRQFCNNKYMMNDKTKNHIYYIYSYVYQIRRCVLCVSRLLLHTTLQYYATMCCNVLQCTATRYNVLQYASIYYNMLQYTAICYNVLQYATMCCNAL